MIEEFIISDTITWESIYAKARRTAGSICSRIDDYRWFDDFVQEYVTGAWDASKRVDSNMSVNQQLAFICTRGRGNITDFIRKKNKTKYKSNLKIYCASRLSYDKDGEFPVDVLDRLSGAIKKVAEVDFILADSNFNFLVNSLPQRHRMITKKYVVDGFSMREIASVISLSEARVSQIMRESFKMLLRDKKDFMQGLCEAYSIN